MLSDLSTQLRHIVETELPQLRELSEKDASLHPTGLDSWSPKQELGHLIDSAANNHIRFVRATIEPELHGPTYAQNEWVDSHGYSEMPWPQIIDFWAQYNNFLADFIGRIPPAKSNTSCFIGSGEPCSLAYLIDDYILHLKHHVDHLLRREKITVYPSQKALSTT